MSADFETPGRQTNGAPGGGSSSRRVVRSALEVLLETKSPYLANGGRSPAQPPPPASSDLAARSAPEAPTVAASPAVPRGFTVTYATHSSAANAPRLSAPSNASGDASRRRTAVEEPSALLFLSPGAGRQPKAVKQKSSAAAAVARTTRAAAPAADTTRMPPPPSPEASRSLLQDVELAGEPSVQLESTPSSSASSVASTNGTATVYSPQQVEAMVTEAVQRYEQQRDEEETAVLTKLDAEISAKERVNRQLLSEKEEIMRVAKSLQEQLTQTLREHEAVKTDLQAAQHAEQQWREKLSRAEVDLCHAKDAQRLAAASQAESLGKEALAREQTAADLRAELASTKQALAELTTRHTALESQRREADETMQRVQAEHDEEYDEIRRKMHFFGQSMAETTATLEAKDRALAALQAKLGEAEKTHKAQLTAAQAERETATHELSEVRTALQQQTDEVRRRMAKIAALESEKAALRKRLRVLGRALVATSEHQRVLQHTLEDATAHVRQELRKAVCKHSTDLAQGSGPLPPPNALNDTNPFASDNDEGDDANDEMLSVDLGDVDSCGEVEEQDAVKTTGTPRAAAQPRMPTQRTESASPRRGGQTGRTASAGGTAAHRDRGASRAAKDSAAAAVSDEEVESACQALRRSCAACTRLSREFTVTVDTSARRLRAQLHAVLRQSEVRAGATKTAEDLARRLETACRYLKEQLAAAEKSAEAARSQCDEHSADLAAVEATLHALEEQKEQLTERCAALDAKRETAVEAQGVAEEELLRLHGELQKALATLQAREDETSVLRKRCEEATHQAEALATAEEQRKDAALALAEEKAACAALSEQIHQLEAERDAALTEGRTARERMGALQVQLQAGREQQLSQRAQESRDAQLTAGELTRLRSALDSVTADCGEARGLLAKERALRSEETKKHQDALGRQSEVTQTLREQLTQLVCEMETRRSGEHATLETIVGALHATQALRGEETGPEDSRSSNTNAALQGALSEDEGVDSGEAMPFTAPVAGTPRREAILGLSPIAAVPGLFSSARKRRGDSRVPGSTESSPAAGVRVALLAGSLSAEKRTRAAAAQGQQTKPAAARTNSARTAKRKKGTAVLRREAVQAAQQVAMEVTRLQEVERQVRSTSPSPLDGEHRAEEAARRSAARQYFGAGRGATVFGGSDDTIVSRAAGTRLFAGDADADEGGAEVETYFDYYFTDGSVPRAAPSVVPRGAGVRPADARGGGRSASTSPSTTPVVTGGSPFASLSPLTSRLFHTHATSAHMAGKQHGGGSVGPLAKTTASVYARSLSSSPFISTAHSSRAREGSAGMSRSASHEVGGSVDGASPPARPPSLGGGGGGVLVA